jgi:hypothetical protein
MSYPARGLGISLCSMQHLPALGRETSTRSELRPLFSRIVAQWILSLLVATWPKPKGAVAGKRRRAARGPHLR